MADDEAYRDLDCNAEWEKFDPIDRLGGFLVQSGVADEAWLGEADETALARVEDAVEFAKAAPEPELDTLYDGLYSDAFMEQQRIGR